ncbi:phosphoadenosine phosphosulfate reductase domain-containing protein [Methylobacterium brachiatum]
MTPENMDLSETIRVLIDRGALFVGCHSGGKDSQALLCILRSIVPADQLLVLHADLAEVEWKGTLEHAKKDAGNLPFRVCKSETKTFLSMVEKRGMFPDPQRRQCTSDLKRGPMEKAIRHYLKEPGNEHFLRRGLVVNCMGMRAEESASRKKLAPFKLNEKCSVAGREWYDWLPIHDMKLEQVWRVLREANRDVHFAYRRGMSRLSCAFCIMSSEPDLRTAAVHNPELFQKYVELERSQGRSMLMPKKGLPQFLEDVVGMSVDEVKAAMHRRETGESHHVRIESEDDSTYIDVLDPSCAHELFHARLGEPGKASFLSGDPAYLLEDGEVQVYLTREEIISLMAGTMPVDDVDRIEIAKGPLFTASEMRMAMLPYRMPPAPSMEEAAAYAMPCAA